MGGEGGPVVGRRAVLRAGVAAAAAMAGARYLVPGPGWVAAAPVGQDPVVRLVWQPWRVGWGSGWSQVFYDATAPFRAANPGVDVAIDVSDGTWSNDGAVLAAILAGEGPDVYSGFAPAKMIEGDYNLDLAPYLKAYNVDTTQFDAGQFAKYVTRGGVWALPAELSTSAVAVNLTALDELGLPYPSRDWDYQEAERLWRAVAKPAANPAQVRVGFAYWGQKAAWLPGDFYWRGWGASAAAGEYSARCGLASPEALRFGAWWFPLASEGVVSWLGAAPPWPQQVVCGFAGSWSLPTFAEMRSVKWDFWPQPAWPTGTTAYAGNDYYAVAANTRHPEAAAAFAIWLTTSTAWQRAMMRFQLVLPPTKGLWPEWADFVRSVAPPLAGKNLEAFTVAAFQGRAFNHPAFAYFSDGAYGIIGQYIPQIVQRKLSVEEGLQEAARAVDTFEAASAAMTAAAAKTAALLRATATAKGPVRFPAPSVRGFGRPASAPPPGAIVQQGGTWTLVGDGADVWGTSDNCVFAGVPWQESDGVFTCRVAVLANVDCPSLSVWAKVGLMARGDLSDDAPAVLVCASGANGVFTDVRTQAGASMVQQGPVSPPPTSGLIGAPYLTYPVTEKVPNYLRRPVWLRLVRHGASWQPYSSFDGERWTPAGSPLVAEMAGCWVGIFCLAHNADFGGRGRIRAVFDHLSFVPDTLVQLGQPGAP